MLPSPFPAFPGGLSLDSCMVDPSEAQHMGQMHHFCLLDEMLVPRAREYAASICLYSPSCREGWGSRKLVRLEGLKEGRGFYTPTLLLLVEKALFISRSVTPGPVDFPAVVSSKTVS